MLLKLFTRVELDEIDRLCTTDIIAAKRLMAYEITKLVHGEKEADNVMETIQSLFGKTKDDGQNAPESDYEIVEDEISVLARRITYLLGQIRSLLDQKVQKETAAKEAVLLALQHQINPHFLYNTMEVFSARMELAGLYEESGAISAFCRMLRYNMNTKDMMVAIKQEVRQVKDYLAIQRIRNIPFEIVFDIPPELMEEPVIRFLLEPFVENSFKYRGSVSPLYIRILVQRFGQQMEISIENNGESISPDRMAELNERFRNEPVSVKSLGNHIGLTNINSRLKLFYGEDHYIQVRSNGGITAFRFCVERRTLPSQSEKGAPV